MKSVAELPSQDCDDRWNDGQPSQKHYTRHHFVACGIIKLNMTLEQVKFTRLYIFLYRILSIGNVNIPVINWGCQWGRFESKIQEIGGLMREIWHKPIFCQFDCFCHNISIFTNRSRTQCWQNWVDSLTQAWTTLLFICVLKGLSKLFYWQKNFLITRGKTWISASVTGSINNDDKYSPNSDKICYSPLKVFLDDIK